MTLLIEIVVNQILPVFLLIGVGALFGHFLKPDVRSLSRAALYVFSPALVVSALTSDGLALGELWQVSLLALVIILLSALVGFLIARILRLDRPKTAALVLVMLISNTGNMGLPVTLFAFGEEALTRAIAYFVTSTLCVFSLGILIASSGRASIGVAIKEALKVPVIYALILSVIIMVTGIELPTFLNRSITLLGQATIPVMLTLLGVQIVSVKLPPNLNFVALAAGMRLLIGPVIGALIVWLAVLFVFPELPVTAMQAVIIESSMPIAVFTTILAVEYDVEPGQVTGAVVLSTLLSPLTLTPLIYLLTNFL